MKKAMQYLTAGDTLDMDELLAIADADTAAYDDDKIVSVNFRNDGTRQAGRMPMAA